MTCFLSLSLLLFFMFLDIVVVVVVVSIVVVGAAYSIVMIHPFFCFNQNKHKLEQL